MPRLLRRLLEPPITVGREFGAAPETVWDLLTDTRLWPCWGPSVRAAYCSERRIGKGTRGWILTAFGLALPFRVTAYEEGRFWAWKVAGIPATGHRVIPLGPESCRLLFELPRLAAPYGAVCRRAARNLARLLAAPDRGLTSAERRLC